MKYTKYIIALTCGLFSVVSQAESRASLLSGQQNNVLQLDGTSASVNISVKDVENIKGDAGRYIVAKAVNGNISYVLEENRGWRTFVWGEEVEPATQGTVKDFDFNLDSRKLGAGNYTIYQVIINKASSSPYEPENWLPSQDENSLKKLNVKVTVKPVSTPVEIPNNTDSQSANTSFSPDRYFIPTLPKRALGDKYQYVVNSKQKWDQIKDSDRQRKTLYWTGKDKLAKLVDADGVQIDRLWQNSVPKKGGDAKISSEGVKLTIAAPLTSIHITGYPGCAGISNLETHPRVCGENNPKVLDHSEVISQRWYRPSNLDVIGENSLYKDIPNKSDIKYDLFASVDIVNIMDLEDIKKTTILFEMSVSVVPGDFSENACKPVGKIKYHNSATVHLTQRGLGSYFALTEQCKIDSTEIEHYYINVRAVGVDAARGKIVESPCNAAARCKFELSTSLDR